MKKKHNLREDSKILVEHILNQDPLAANSVFQRIIAEAEAAREEEVADELGLDDLDAETDADAVDTDDVEELDDSELSEIESAEDVESIDNAESEAIVDDIVEINCQINAKLVSKLFDKIADLKNQIQSLGLDENSREYLKYDVSIQYYSDKLQELQNKTNPGIDQSKVEEALTKISTAIDELAGEAGNGSDESFDDIDTPDEVAADNDLSDMPEETEETVEETEEIEGEEPAEDVDADIEANPEEETEVSDEEEIEEIFN